MVNNKCLWLYAYGAVYTKYIFFFYLHEVKGLTAACMTKENVNKQKNIRATNKRHTKKLRNYCPKN